MVEFAANRSMRLWGDGNIFTSFIECHCDCKYVKDYDNVDG